MPLGEVRDERLQLLELLELQVLVQALALVPGLGLALALQLPPPALRQHARHPQNRSLAAGH